MEQEFIFSEVGDMLGHKLKEMKQWERSWHSYPLKAKC